MSLADRDIQRIADAVAERFDRDPPQGIVDAVYKKLDENALTGIRDRLDVIDDRLDSMNENIESMGEDLGKVMDRTNEIAIMNENIQALRNHAGI